jgi:hypothetical protein
MWRCFVGVNIFPPLARERSAPTCAAELSPVSASRLPSDGQGGSTPLTVVRRESWSSPPLSARGCRGSGAEGCSEGCFARLRVGAHTCVGTDLGCTTEAPAGLDVYAGKPCPAGSQAAQPRLRPADPRCPPRSARDRLRLHAGHSGISLCPGPVLPGPAAQQRAAGQTRGARSASTPRGQQPSPAVRRPTVYHPRQRRLPGRRIGGPGAPTPRATTGIDGPRVDFLFLFAFSVILGEISSAAEARTGLHCSLQSRPKTM